MPDYYSIARDGTEGLRLTPRTLECFEEAIAKPDGWMVAAEVEEAIGAETDTAGRGPWSDGWSAEGIVCAVLERRQAG